MNPPELIRRKLVGGSVQILLAEGLGLPAGILAAAYLTRQLGPAGYGLFALAASFVATLEWFVTAMLSRASIKQTAETGEWRGIAVALLRRHLAIGLVLGGGCWAVAGLLGSWLNAPSLPSLLRLAAVQVPIVAVTSALMSTLVGRGLYRPRAIARAVRWVSRLIFIMAFVGVGLGIQGAILAGICSALTSLVIAHVSLRLHPFERAAPLVAFWRLAFAVFTTVASVRLLEKMGLILLKAFGGTVAEVGYYAAAQNFTLGPGLFAMSIAPLLLSAVAQAHRNDNPQLARVMCRDALRGITWLLPLAGIAAGAASELVTLVYGPQFFEAGPLARYLVFSGVALAGLSVTSAILAAFDRAKWAVAATAPVLPLALIGYVLVVPRWGAIGAAAVTTVSSALGLIGTLFVVHRLIGMSPPRGTLLRALVVTALCWIAAAMWSTPGALVMVKGIVIGVAALVVIALLGELTPGEMNILWTLLPWSPRDGQHHRLVEPPVEYLRCVHGRSEAACQSVADRALGRAARRCACAENRSVRRKQSRRRFSPDGRGTSTVVGRDGPQSCHRSTRSRANGARESGRSRGGCATAAVCGACFRPRHLELDARPLRLEGRHRPRPRRAGAGDATGRRSGGHARQPPQRDLSAASFRLGNRRNAVSSGRDLQQGRAARGARTRRTGGDRHEGTHPQSEAVSNHGATCGTVAAVVGSPARRASRATLVRALRRDAVAVSDRVFHRRPRRQAGAFRQRARTV